MRRCLRFVVLPVFILALLWSGAVAQAAPPLIGISQSYRDFGLKTTRSQSYEASHDVSKSTAWRDVGANTLRVIVPWDIALRPASDGIRREFENWISRARASDVSADPYVVFGPTNSATNLANPSHVTHRTAPDGPVAPFVEDYRTAITAFMFTWGPKTAAGIRLIGAWNEPNLKEVDMSIPNPYDGPIFLPKSGGATTTWMSSLANCPSGATTSNCGPLMAAHYWKNANEVMNVACQGSGKDCYVVAGEFDSTPTAKSYWNTYANKLQDIAPLPTIISFHAHRDAHPLGEHTNASLTVDHDCRPGNEKWCVTAQFYTWLKNRKDGWSNRTNMRIWSTEVGVEYRGGYSTWEPNSEQWNRFNDLLAISEKYRVKRMYYFNFQGSGVTDRGLIEKGSTVNTATRKIWGKIKSMQCPGGCSSPRAIAAVVTPEESYEEPPELPEGEEEGSQPPAVETGKASALYKTAATLNATVNPQAQQTNYFFEYGPTQGYGTTTPSLPVGNGTQTEALAVSALVNGLRPGTTYHFRVVASNAAGTRLGEDQTFTTEQTPRESDINGDGRSDFVILSASGYVTSRFGQADGSLGYAIGSATGFEPALADGQGYYPIDVEDVNGDGYDDLVTMHSGGAIGTHLGAVTGSFGPTEATPANNLKPSVLAPAEGEYEPIAVSDTNRDGRGDLVVYDNVSKTVYTHLGQAQGGFSTARIASLSGLLDSANFDGEGRYPLDVADVTGDSHGELVVQNSNGSIETFLATGEGGFYANAQVSWPGALQPSMKNGSGYEPVAVADVDGDGRADFVAHHSNGTLSTFRGQADATFGAKVNTPGSFDSDLFDGTGSELATVIDVNGDGAADLVNANRGNGNVYVHLGQLDGSFGAATTNLGGSFNSSRVNRGTGWQIVMEKPIRRRQACAPTGCSIDPRSDVNGDHRSDLATLSAAGNVATYAGAVSATLNAAVAARGSIDPAQYDGQGHYPLDVEDINGDGYDDLVSLHSSGTVYTYLGNASGSFPGTVSSNANALAPALRFPGLGEYEPIGVGDANDDGRGDLIVYNAANRTVYTHLGQAGGGFSSSGVNSLAGDADSAYFDRSGEYFVGVADVNGDGRTDLVAHTTDGSVKTYLANIHGVFEKNAAVSLANALSPSMKSGSGYEPVAVADVNGDGRADFVVHHSSGPIRTYLGQFDGSFTTQVETPGPFDSNLFDGTGSELGTVIDVNGDGFGDLLWAKASDGNVYVQPGKRDGGFGPATTNLGGSYVSTRHNRVVGQQMINEQPLRRRSACRLTGCGLDPRADVNADGRADLVTVTAAGTVNAYLGQSSGSLGAAVVSRANELDPAQYDGVGFYPLAVEDIDGDGYDDLVSLHSSGTVRTFRGQADGSVAAPVSSLTSTVVPSTLAPAQGEYEPIGVGDATGDGRGDLVVFNNYNRTVYTYAGQANSGFAGPPVGSVTLASGTGNADSALFDNLGDYFVGVADVTGDGLADLVAQNTTGVGETYKATGSGGFLGSPVVSLAGAMNPAMATGGGHEPIAVADVNGDGRADLVTNSGDLRTHLGQADGSFSAAVTSGSIDSNLFDGTGSELGTVIDVNGDGFGDLVWAKASDGNVYVQPGKRNGSFGAATTNLGGSYVSTRHSRAAGSQMVDELPLRRRSACRSTGCGLDARADVNADGRADLVTLHTSGSVYTYRGQANGEFAAAKVSSMTLASGSNGVMDPAQYDGVGYYPLAVEDVNGDGYDDLVALDSSGTVTVYPGATTAEFSGAAIYSLQSLLVPAILAPSPGKYEPIGVGDTNGDLRGDLVVFDSADKKAYTFLGQENGTFSSAKVASLTTSSGTGIGDSALFDSAGDYFVGVADVTGDGLADLVSHRTNGSVVTYKATGSGGFLSDPAISFGASVSPSLATGAGYEPVAVADINGDGRADFVAHHPAGALYAYLGQSNGTFTYRLTAGYADSNLYDGEGSELGTVIDVNGDGFGDLISADRGNGNVYVHLGEREGTLAQPKAQLGGGYVSTRHSQSSGQQMVSEQPLRRRSACAANGCH